MNQPELLDAKTIAKRLGVVPSAVVNWQARLRSFPMPAVWVGRHKLWNWSEVQEWYNSGDKPTERRWVNGRDTRNPMSTTNYRET